MRLSNGLAHISWFCGLGKRVFGYFINLFGSEDLVHGACGHCVCARGGGLVGRIGLETTECGRGEAELR